MNLAKSIIEKLFTENGYSTLELGTNIGLNNLIELIANEQKCSYVEGDGPDWEAKLWVQSSETKYLEIEDIKPIIKTILSSETNKTAPQRLMSYLTTVPGLGILLNKYITTHGTIEFEPCFSELGYISENLFDEQGNVREDIFKKIIYPFYKRNVRGISQDQKQEYVDKAILQLSKIIQQTAPDTVNPNATAEYFLTHIVELPELTRISNNSLAVISDKLNVFKRFQDRKFEKNGLRNSCRYTAGGNLTRILKKWEEISSELKILSNGIAGQLFINSQELANKTPEQVEEILKTAYTIYTKHETHSSFIPAESGYRIRNVSMGGKDVYLHRQNGRLEKAMGNLSKSIVNLVGNSEEMTNQEYISEVAKIHFRYISIHPFRDSNGRTGRNLINLLLSQKGLMFVLPKNDKNTYLNIMNMCRENIALRQYLDALVDSPETLPQYEDEISKTLGEFINQNTYEYSKDVEQCIQEKSMERYKQSQSRTKPNFYNRLA